MTTSTDTKMAWQAVADRLSALGLKLQVHFQEAGSGAQPAQEVSDAFQRLRTAIDSTCSAIGSAVHDPAVRDDADSLATALGEALANTLSEAGEELAAAARGLRCERGAAKKEDADKT